MTTESCLGEIVKRQILVRGTKDGKMWRAKIGDVLNENSIEEILNKRFDLKKNVLHTNAS